MSGAVPALPNLNLGDTLLGVEKEETEMDKVLALLLDEMNIAHNTELNRNEITAFSILGAIVQQRPQLTALGQYLAKNLVYRVSKGRQGRKEWVKITSRSLAQQDNQMEQPTGFRRFMGGNKPR